MIQKPPTNIYWSSTRLQRNNFSSSKTSWRRLEDVLKMFCKHILKTSWRRLEHISQDVLKTSWRGLQDVLEDEKLLRWRRLEDVLKTCLEDVLKTSWRQTKCLLGISVSNHGLLTNLNQYLTNLYLTNLYFTNLRRM